MAVATLQGIINRKGPRLYLLSRKDELPKYWLQKLSQEGRWLHGRKIEALADLDALVALAGPDLRGTVIWDPAVPASVNVATTVAGVEDAVVLSPDLAARRQEAWKLGVVKDLRGLFTGSETGSRKNDAYRWAVREYLAKGRCSAHWFFSYEDAFSTRARGDIAYVVTRDWAVRNRGFVFDLSPWGDEAPADDPYQRVGTDLETYRLVLAEMLKASGGKQMTELAGFFAFAKCATSPAIAAPTSRCQPSGRRCGSSRLSTPTRTPWRATASTSRFTARPHAGPSARSGPRPRRRWPTRPTWRS